MKRFMTFVLSLLAILSLGITIHVGAASNDLYTKVESLNDLAIGDNIIIVNEAKKVALGTTQNKNNRGQADITITSEGVAITPDVEVIVLEEGKKEATFALKTDAGYLYAASSSSNWLRTQDNIDDNASWKISFKNETAEIVAQGNSKRNSLRYNNQGMFACYTGGQEDIAIYKAAPSYDTVVSFDNNDGTNTINKLYKNSGDVINALEVVEPTRSHYSFDGWFTDKLEGEKLEFPLTVEAEATYYAHWSECSKHTITFVYNDGVTENKVTEPTYTGEAIKIAEPTREGYLFDGWSLNEDLSEPQKFSEVKVSDSDTTYYAKWTKRLEGSVTYFANGYTYETVTGYENDPVKAVEDPVREGYEFAGWLLELNSGEAIDIANAKYSKENVTYYASWRKPAATDRIEDFSITVADFKSDGYNKPFDNPYNLEATGVGKVNNMIQFRKNSGALSNQAPISNLNTITITGDTVDFTIYSSKNPIDSENLKDLTATVITKDNNTHTILDGEKYFLIKNGADNSRVSEIAFKAKEIVDLDGFTSLQTHASLKLSYNEESLEVSKVKLSFGGIIPLDMYNLEAEYGVIALEDGMTDELTYANLEALKNSNKAAKAADIKLVDGGYQYSFDLELQSDKYNTTYNAYMYTIVNDELVLAKLKSASVISAATIYKTMNSLNSYSKVLDNILGNK